MKIRRTIIGSVAVVALTASTAACGATAPSSSRSTGSAASTGGSGHNTLVVADGTLDTLLPAATQLSFNELQELFAPLVAFHKNGSLRYVQAKSVVASNNDKVWTITLRPGWTFDNGQQVTAQSYVDGWNFTAYGPNANSNASELSEIQGYSAVNPTSGKPTAKTLSGLKVLSTDVFQVTLSSPDSQFPVELCTGDTGFYPMPTAGLANVKAFAKDPIGDGPYEMNGVANLNSQVDMKAYPGYKGTKPKTKYLKFELFSNPDTAYTATQAGTVNIDTTTPQDKYSQIKTDFGSHVLDIPGGSLDFLGFPLFEKKFQSIDIRKAISLAINRKAIATALLGGQSVPAKGILAPGLLGGGTGNCTYCTYDPAKARKLLAAAGGWKGPMVIAYPGGAGYDQEFQAIANQLRQNLHIASVTAQPSTNFTTYFSALSKHAYTEGPFRGHWGSLYPSGANILSSLFLPGAAFNDSVGGYTNPRVTSLIKAGEAASTSAQAIADFQQAQAVLLDNVAVVPLFYPTYPEVYSSNVENVQALPHEIGVNFDAVTVK